MDPNGASGLFSLLPGFVHALDRRSGTVRRPLGARPHHRSDAPVSEATPHSHEQGTPTFELPKLCGVSD